MSLSLHGLHSALFLLCGAALLGCNAPAPAAPVADAIPSGACTLRYVQTFKYPRGVRVSVGSSLTDTPCSAPAGVTVWTTLVDGDSITYEVRR